MQRAQQSTATLVSMSSSCNLSAAVIEWAKNEKKKYKNRTHRAHTGSQTLSRTHITWKPYYVYVYVRNLWIRQTIRNDDVRLNRNILLFLFWFVVFYFIPWFVCLIVVAIRDWMNFQQQIIWTTIDHNHSRMFYGFSIDSPLWEYQKCDGLQFIIRIIISHNVFNASSHANWNMSKPLWQLKWFKMK